MLIYFRRKEFTKNDEKPILSQNFILTTINHTIKNNNEVVKDSLLISKI